MPLLRLTALNIVATIAVSFFCGAVHAAAGDVDPSFGGAGYVRYAAPKSIPGLFAAAVGLDDGSVIVAGGADTDVFVRHYRVDGSIDPQFGDRGTAYVPGLGAGGFTAPAFVPGMVSSSATQALHLFRLKSGQLLLEQSGNVRRLSASGTNDGAYAPARMNIIGSGPTVTFSYAMLPAEDGRFVVVATPQNGSGSSNVSVRFYLPDGRPDTVRGDVNGERILSPADGSTVYRPTSAVADAQGRILIAARVERSTTADTGLVAIRLNPDGGYDTTFGVNGVAVIGASLGIIDDAQIVAGADGRIAFMFSVPAATGAIPYAVVHVLLANGQQDSSAPSGGRISLLPPPDVPLDLRFLRVLSGPPLLTIAGYSGSNEVVMGTNPPPVRRIVQSRIDLSTGVVGAFQTADGGDDVTFILTGLTLAANRVLWAYGSEDNFYYGFARAPLLGSARSVLLPFDPANLAATPSRIIATFDGHTVERFTGVKVLSDGKFLALGNYLARGNVNDALTRFTADGNIDPAYAGGSARRVLGNTGRDSSALLRSPDDRATVLTQYFCSAGPRTYATLQRFAPDGTPDATFGNGGTVAINGISCVVTAPGFVDATGAVTILQGLQPVRYTSTGAVDPTFSAVAQTTQLSGSTAPTLLDRLPDGRLQAVRVSGSIEVFRWLANGAVDDSFTRTTIPISVAGAVNTFDMRILADGRTLLAIDQATQRVLMRLRADGSIDLSFGDGGAARIDGPSSVNGPFAAKLAIDPAGRILYTYNTRLASGGNALTVARFTADGQRDTSFTSDGRFDSVFALSGNDTASDIAVLADGSLLAVGQSDQSGGLSRGQSGAYSPFAVGASTGLGLLLELRGTSSGPVQPGAAVVEFYNTRLQHYFVSGGPGEVMAIDTGGAGPGWQRTGYGFRAYLPETGIPAGAQPVCRFYGTPGRGPNSHFYTVSASECAAVKQDPGWTYEGTAFYLFAPAASQCANGQTPVYRIYNNRFPQNDSNHRYTTDAAIYAQMQQQGWLPEGVVFCGAMVN